MIERLKKTSNPVIFFYCDLQDDRFASAAKVMHSLLCQMLRHLDDNRKSQAEGLIKLLKNSNACIDNQLPSLIADAAAEFRRSPLVIIDALDECKDVKTLLDALMEWTKQGKMRFIVTSRPLQVIKEKLLDVSRILVISWDRFETGVSVDISIFIERELEGCGWFGVVDAAEKKWMMSVLLRKAEGM